MGFEVSPDEVEPSSGGVDDQTDAIPMSSSSDSLSMSDEPDARPTLPTPSDILVSYSTFPGACFFFQTKTAFQIYVSLIPFWPCDQYRLCFLARDPVGLVVRPDTGLYTWGKRCDCWLSHNVDDGELLLIYQKK